MKQLKILIQVSINILINYYNWIKAERLALINTRYKVTQKCKKLRKRFQTNIKTRHV